MNSTATRIIGCYVAAMLSLAFLCGPTLAADAGPAVQILRDSGVKGGLVVHLGCGDGQLTAALRASDSYLVQGLDADAANVAKARQHAQKLGLYGPVSIDQLQDAAALYRQLGESVGGQRSVVRGPR